MRKSADWTDVIDILHKEWKPQQVVAEEAGWSVQGYQQKSQWKEKGQQQQGERQSLEDCQAKFFLERHHTLMNTFIYT